jgi:hypothetical protein
MNDEDATESDSLDTRAGAEGWFLFHRLLAFEMIEHLGLDLRTVKFVDLLFRDTALRVSRAPLPLLADCIYLVAKLTGQRRSIRVMKRATNALWGRSIHILYVDRRKPNAKRWVWTRKEFICDMLSLSPEDWEELVAEWVDEHQNEKIVTDRYWENGGEEE